MSPLKVYRPIFCSQCGTRFIPDIYDPDFVPWANWRGEPMCSSACSLASATAPSTSPPYLEAKVQAAAELFADDEITRGEMFRHEVDASLGRSTGPIKMAPKEPKP